MSEPRIASMRDVMYRSTTPRTERSKSLSDLARQYSRIDNRLYRQYLDYEIDEETFNRRRRAIQDVWDRYETNIMNTQFPGWERGNAYPRNFTLYNRPIARSVYTRNNRR